MDKLTTVSGFTKAVDLLRNTECSQKEKLNYFHQISEGILSPSVISHANFGKHCGSAISVLLLFCEDLDSVIRMNAEENLNKIIRSLESNRLSRVLLDLYGEIRKNGNERSLRICLNLFAYYCPRIKEKNLKWYALKLLPCLQAIAQRKETLLAETLCEFVKSFSKNLEICLNDNETVKLIEVFLAHITSDCAVKRRCASFSCLSLIENSRNKAVMARYGLNKALEFLINDHKTNTVLGVLGFLRLLLPIIIAENICDCKQIVEIYDVCLYLLNNQNHSIINASLEVINSMLSRQNAALEELLTSPQLHHEFLKKRKSLKNQIFQLKNSEMTCGESAQATSRKVGAFTLNKHQPSRKSTSETVKDAFKSEEENTDGSQDKSNAQMRFKISELECRSECNNFLTVENSNRQAFREGDDNGDGTQAAETDFISMLTVNEPRYDGHLAAERNDDKLQVLSDIDNESFNSMDFESEIAFGEKDYKSVSRNEKETGLKSQKSTDSIGSFFNSLISHSNAESMTKLFRPSTKSLGTATDSSTTSTPKGKKHDEKFISRLQRQPQPSVTVTTIGITSPSLASNVAETQTVEDDTISLESINSHISLASHVSFQSSTQDLLRNEQDLVLVQNNEYENKKNFEILRDPVTGAMDTEVEETASVTAANAILSERSVTEYDKMRNNFIVGNDVNEKDKAFADDFRVKVDIGTIYDQPIIYYTARLIASKFLLSGVPGSVIPDTVVRISIKNLSLNVIANCVKLKPDVLGCSLAVDKSEIIRNQWDSTAENSSNEFNSDFTMPDEVERDDGFCNAQSLEDNLLEMKDDHFGESNTMFFLNSPLSKSADPVLVKEIKSSGSGEYKQKHDNSDLTTQLENILCKSEIIESDSCSKQTRENLTSAPQTPPSAYSTPLAKTTPNVLLSEKSNSNDLAQIGFQQQKQFVHDILLFYDHPDPILRGDVQIIVGNFMSTATLTAHNNSAELMAADSLDFNRLLAILVKGLRDEIHTVVIQALTSFDRVFPLLMSNYFSTGNKQRVLLEDDEDAGQFVENILCNEFNVDRKYETENKLNYKAISPKCLLNQLRLCYYNKYWLVQNKYAEVISNLNYNVIQEYYGDDVARSYENMFLDELLQLLGDEDFRVRENIGDCLCRYIKASCQNVEEMESHGVNLNLLREFLDHRVFQGMPKSLRNLFNDKVLPSFEQERKLSKVLYMATNKLMELHEKNHQFGIINTIKVLSTKFNLVDYYATWSEFNFAEVCLKFAFQNYTTAADLNCQSDLIEITVKLLAANILHGNINQNLIDILLGHIMKILNIYYHLFSNQKPVLFAKAQKGDIFANTKELSTVNKIGYFGDDYLYIKLYNVLKSAFGSFKITINQESGTKLMSLVTACLGALSLLLEIQEHSKSLNVIKLIEEILLYLSILINYEPVETVGCLRQLLKFLFGRNYVNRRRDYEKFTELYFTARKTNMSRITAKEDEKKGVGKTEFINGDSQNFRDLFANAMNFPLGKVKSEEECARHIKLFEPLVIYCLTLFMKSNATVQAPILELLTQLLEFNVTYSILDSKNVIFDNVMRNLELLESGIAGNCETTISSTIKFLVNLTKQNNSKLVTIPKIISIVNNLLANSSIQECSVLALKFLTFEIFFNTGNFTHPDYGSNTSLHAKELSTQKEVILGMLEKFIGYTECQKTLSILLLWNKANSDVALNQEETVYPIVTKGLVEGKIKVHNLETFFVLNSLFRNCDKNVLLNAKEFSSLLSLFMTKNVDNFNDLSCVTIILDKVLLNAEEIYLANHVKLFVKNHHCSLSTDEINYFTKALYEKLDMCFSTFIKYAPDKDFCILAVKFVKNFWKISRSDAINSTFRRELIENFFYGKYSETILREECLQVEILQALCDMNLDKILILLQLQKVDRKSVRRTILQKICTKFSGAEYWKTNEVEILLSNEFLPLLISERFNLVEVLCNSADYSRIVVRNLLNSIHCIQDVEIPFTLILIDKAQCDTIKLEVLSEVYNKVKRKKSLRTIVERAFKQEIITNSDSTHIQGVKSLLMALEKTSRNSFEMNANKEEVDEKWMIDQIIQLSSTLHSAEYVRILLDIKSEIKLKSIFNSIKFNTNNVLKSCIDVSFEAMILSFQNDCIQHNPHINYLKMNLLAKMAINSLINEVQDIITLDPLEEQSKRTDFSLVSTALVTLFEKIEKLKNIGLIFVEYKFLEKFIKEQIFKSVACIELLIDFLIWCCNYIKEILMDNDRFKRGIELSNYYRCISKLLHHEVIWFELNQPEKYVPHLNTFLDMVYDAVTKLIRNTIFYKRYKMQTDGYCEDKSAYGNVEDVAIIQKAIFIAKLIETKIDTGSGFEIASMKILKSIAVTLFRMDQFYVYAVTPLEIFQSCGLARHMKSTPKLPSIPVEQLSDVDILQKFVKRLSIFGFSARQQFEEYFMTFLLLINKTYDDNMVDVQEQYQIKSTCLEAILELLITCHTFPITGNKCSRFHHTTRWPHIKCDSISSKKLHKIQLLVPGSNIFNHPNLERDLRCSLKDNVIGTDLFLTNQYGLNFTWQQMENTMNEGETNLDVHSKNIRYFTDLSGIDFKSSFQLIYDVLIELIEQNHVIVLPNLVKFCEICENRDQIRGIKDKILKLQEVIAIDDTISHQYIIYLLCKTQSLLVPSYADLSHLCSIISTYLRSSHVFIRNATLHGLLCLLECCSKTSTTIGKLSEELSMLRDLIVDYITRHGIIEESPLVFSDVHTKLVWALNFSLIETTTKFVPECNLLSNSIISANNLLKRTTNENIYLCVLHGIERIIVINSSPQPICDKIEKLSLELVKLETERFCLPALKLLLSCIYTGSSTQLKNTELSNGIVQDDPEIIAQQTEKVDVLLHCIKSSTSSAAKIYGEVLCQIIRDLVPPNEILTKVIKEFLAINQPHCEVIARIVYQVFRSAIDSSFLQMLQDWLICSLPTFVTLPEEKGVWCLTVIFLSASINLHLIKLFPVVLYDFCKLGDSEISLFLTSARDFYGRLNADQKRKFRDVVNQSELNTYKSMLKVV